MKIGLRINDAVVNVRYTVLIDHYFLYGKNIKNAPGTISLAAATTTTQNVTTTQKTTDKITAQNTTTTQTTAAAAISGEDSTISEESKETTETTRDASEASEISATDSSAIIAIQPGGIRLLFPF